MMSAGMTVHVYNPPSTVADMPHAIPGAFFTLWGVWWMFMSMWVHLTRKLSIYSKDTGPYAEALLQQKSYIPQPFLKRIPLEPIVKIILPSVGICMETFFHSVLDREGGSHFHIEPYFYFLVDLKDSHGNFNPLNQLSHITMYSFFVLSGIIDLVFLCMHARVHHPSLKHPPHITHIFLSMAFATQGFIFCFHSFERRLMLDSKLHILLTLAIFGCILFSALRMLKATNSLINICLSFTIFLQGTWLIAIQIVSDGPSPWDEQDPMNAQFIVLSFTWHWGFIIIGFLIVYVVLRCILKSYAMRKGLIYSTKPSSFDGGEMKKLTEQTTFQEDNV